MSGLGVIGVGLHLPATEVSNTTIAARCGVDAGWLESRTGIVSRRRAAQGSTLADLAAPAAAQAIVAAGRPPDSILLAASVPDRPMPPTAPMVQRKLGLPGVPAFDVNAACAGFVHALALAWGTSRVGVARTPLVIGADMLSRYCDPHDRRTAPLFGDGAGAFMLGQVPEGYGLLAARLWTDGTLSELARIQLRPRPREGEAIPGAEYFELDGRGATEVVLRVVPNVLRACLKDVGIPAQELDRLILHQANVRLVEALAEDLGLCEWQVPMTGRSTGNTGAASVPVGLALSHQEKPLSRGDMVALATIGAGASVATAVLRWY